MANPSSSGYGNWDSGSQQWRSWVKIERTSLSATEAKFKVTAWMCANNGSSSYASNIKGWAGIWDAATGDYRWSSSVNVGNFSAGDEWEFKSQTWTVKRTHISQTVYGYSYIKAESGIYSGRTSNNSGDHAVTLTLDAKPSYTVSYNANGGSGGPSSPQTKWHDETLTLSDTVPTKSGYTFLGWATSSSATSAAYAAGASYTENAARTLYAVWRKAITLTYNANGGSGAPSAVTKYVYNSTTSASFTISSTTPAKSGYTFLGWATSSTATSANGSYDPGDSPTLSSNVTLYAVWRKAITLTYNSNGGGGAPAAVTQYAYNSATSSTFTISSTSPTRAGYTFLGWATSSTATTANGSYGAGKSVTLSASKTVYAVWRASAPTLTGVRAWRSDSTGAEADEGTCASVALSWTMASAAAVTVTATVNGHSGTVTFDSATSGTVDTGAASPTHPIVIGDAALSTELSYTVTIEATANGNTTTVSATVPVAYFHIDLKANGHGVGIGMPAPSGVLGVGIDAEFHGSVDAEGPLAASGGEARLTGDGTWVYLGDEDGEAFAFNKGTGMIRFRDGSWGDQIYRVQEARAANTVLAGPSSGSAANAAFRALVAADIPNLAASKIASGTFDAARIPSLAASKIASGTFDAARIPSISGEGKLGWVSLGSVTSNAAETNKLTLSLTGYEELLILCRYGTTYNASALVKASWLSSTSRDYYLGGWYRTATYASAIALTNTSATPYRAYVNGSAVNATWYLYAR